MIFKTAPNPPHSVAKTIFRNSIWLISGEVLSKTLVVLFTIVVARKLGVADFGKYGFALSLVMVFSLFIDFGLTTLIIRETSREKELASKYVSNALILRIILSLIFFSIISLVVKILSYPQETRMLVYLLWGWISIINLSYVFRAIFKARERMEYEGFLNFFHNFTRLMLLVAFLAAGFGLLGVGMSMLVASMFLLAISITIFSRRFEPLHWKADPSFWLPSLKEAFPLALASMFFSYFGRIDNILLSFMKGDETVGIYNASLTLIWALIFIPGLTTQAAFPKLSEYAIRDAKKFENLLAYTLKANLIFGTLLTLGIFLFSSQIILLIYGNKYSQSLQVLQILIWAYPAHAAISVLLYGLNAKNRQRTNALITGSILLLNILLNFILIPKYGYLGAASATLISIWLLPLTLIMFFIKKGYVHPKALVVNYTDLQIIKGIILGHNAGK